MAFLSIFVTEQSVIALAEQSRTRCPVRQPFPEEVTNAQKTYGGFFPCSRDNGEFYLSFLNVKNCIGSIALSEYALLLGVRGYCPAVIDSG